MVDGGRLGWRRIGAMATASTPPLVLVLRAAASQTRCLPVWSVHSIFRSSVHFASSADSGEMRLILGDWVAILPSVRKSLMWPVFDQGNCRRTDIIDCSTCIGCQVKAGTYRDVHWL